MTMSTCHLELLFQTGQKSDFRSKQTSEMNLGAMVSSENFFFHIYFFPFLFCFCGYSKTCFLKKFLRKTAILKICISL